MPKIQSRPQSPRQTAFLLYFPLLIQQYWGCSSAHSRVGTLRSIHCNIPAFISALFFELWGYPHAVFTAMCLREDRYRVGKIHFWILDHLRIVGEPELSGAGSRYDSGSLSDRQSLCVRIVVSEVKNFCDSYSYHRKKLSLQQFNNLTKYTSAGIMHLSCQSIEQTKPDILYLTFLLIFVQFQSNRDG